ncbi:MAG: hypothetical protein ACTS7E_00950 [Arsenophonus sp. NC-CH8-MAG3]
MVQNKFSGKRKSDKSKKITRDLTYYTACLSESLYDLPSEVNDNRSTKFL